MYSSKEMLIGFEAEIYIFQSRPPSHDRYHLASGRASMFRGRFRARCDIRRQRTRSLLDNTDHSTLVRISPQFVAPIELLEVVNRYSVDAIVLCVVGVVPRTL